MSFTPNNQFELQGAGQADWDSGQSANWSIVERGFHYSGTAGAAISSGQVCIVNTAGYVIPMDSRSHSNAHVMAPFAVASGASGQFLLEGIVSSMSVWSGNITPGLPVYVSPASPGFCVSSYPAHGHAVGLALSNTSIRFQPGFPQVFPQLTTETDSVGPIQVGTGGVFTMQLANRGIARQLRVITNSCDNYKVRFWSGSARVSSEALYETLTTSGFDVRTLNYLDQAGFPWYNTDTASPALVFGRIDVQSGSSVTSANFSVQVTVERFR